MAAAPPGIEELSAQDAYSGLYYWLQSSEAINSLEEGSGKQGPPEAPLQLIKTMPSPESATSGDMRLVFSEVRSGTLEYFYSASDGRATMADYAHAGIEAMGGPEFTPEEAAQLVDSPMLPAALHLDTILSIFAKDQAGVEPVTALDQLSKAYQYARRELELELWQELFDTAARQSLGDPERWERTYQAAMDRVAFVANERDEQALLELFASRDMLYEEAKRKTAQESESPPESASKAPPAAETESAAPPSSEIGSEVPQTPETQVTEPNEPVETQPAELADSNLAPAYLSDALGTTPGLQEAKLGIEPDVRAISTVMMNASWEPPLAVGLFGRWGAGKSFFMNQLRSQVDKLAAASREAVRGGSPGPLCRRPVQISFNAWHYIDANLWASLVVRIFDGLAAEMSPKLDKDAKKDALVRELATFQTLQQETEERRERAQEQLDRVQARARQARGRVQVAEGLLEAADKLGISSAREVDRLATTLQKNYGTLRALLSSPRGYLRLLTVAAAVIAIFVEVPQLKDLLKDWTEPVLAFVAAIPGLQLFQRRAELENTARVIGEVLQQEGADSADKTLPGVFTSGLFDPGDTIGTEKRLKLELDRITTEEIELSERYEEIKREIEELSPRHQLSRLVEDRAGKDSSYRRAQGLVSMIREDFAELEGTLKRLHTKARLMGGASSGEKIEFPIDRIILYIDDLDRCPADRVSEVLQAVHLLLGFEIFVVVVAVDPRWLLKSLQKSYPALLTNVLTEDQSSSATPRDYLEKIFQIPYTIPLMRASNSLDYMEYLLRHKKTAPEPEPAPQTTVQTPVDHQLVQPPATDEDSASREASPTPRAAQMPTPEPGSKLEPDAASRLESPATGTAGLEPETPEQQAETPTDNDAELAAGIDASPATLELSPDEEKLIKALGPIFRTPRAGKRFVNVYRILRVTIEPDKLKDYIRDDCQGVLLLLASVLEYPEVGVYLLRKIRREKKNQLWSDYISALKAEDLPGLSSTASWQLERLQDRTKGIGEVAEVDMSSLALWAERVGRYTFGD